MKLRTGRLFGKLSVVTAFLLMLVLALSAFYGLSAFSASADTAIYEPTLSVSAKTYLDGFFSGGANKSRKYFTEGEAKAADWLNSKAAEITGGAQGFTVEKKEFNVEVSAENKASANVVVTYYPSSAYSKFVTVGAHYDTASDATGADGAYDNASSVAAMLAMINAVAEERPDYGFGIEFVFFGASYYNFSGAANYLNGSRHADMLMYINLDAVGGGDYLYAYADEVERSHLTAFLEYSDASEGEKVRAIPNDIAITPSGFYQFPYYHAGIGSEHVLFMAKNVPVINMFGMNLSATNKIGNVESADKPAIIGTADDNLEKFYSLYPQAGERMDRVALLALGFIGGSDFAVAAEDSRAGAPDYSFWLNSRYAALFSMGIAAAGVIAAMLLGIYFRKKYPPKPRQPVVVIKKPPVFGEEYEKHNIINPPPPPGSGTGQSTGAGQDNTPKPPNPFEGF